VSGTTIQIGIGDKPKQIPLLNGCIVEIKVVKGGIGLAVFCIEDLTEGCPHKWTKVVQENGILLRFECPVCGKVFQ